jgi:hypothetical protein
VLPAVLPAAARCCPPLPAAAQVRKLRAQLARKEAELKGHAAQYKEDQKVLYKEKIVGALDKQNKAAAQRAQRAVAQRAARDGEAPDLAGMPELDVNGSDSDEDE